MHRDRITLLLLSATLSLGAVVSCTSSEPVINGTAGSNGAAGTNGSAGSNGAAGTTAGAAGTTAGAAGSGAAGSTGAAGTGVDAGVDAGPALSFAKDIMPIITANCHDCHQTGTDGMLNMKADANDTLGTTAYTSLVGTGTGGAVKQNTTCKYPAGNAITLRVKPGDPANSLMYLKITTPAAMLPGSCGVTMPKGKTQLGIMTPADATMIHDWIMQGANP